MNRLAYTTSSVFLGLTLAACGDDGVVSMDTESGSSTSTSTSTSGSSTSDVTTDGSTTTDSSTTDPTDPTGVECAPDDDCDDDRPCPGEQACVSCICVGDIGCENAPPEGAYADCLAEGGGVDITSCMNAAARCLVNDTVAPTAAACFFPDCEDECDCPAGPAGFESQVTCDNLTDMTIKDCFLSCTGDEVCPDGMYCDAGACLFGAPPPDIPTYGDCKNLSGICEMSGFCLNNGAGEGTFGVCTVGCANPGECPDAPATGDATVVCVNLTNDQDPECALDCGAGETCPDGMSCFAPAGICVWDFQAPPQVGFSDCANFAEANACVGDEVCFSIPAGGPDPLRGVCAAPCAVPADCPELPGTGDAPIACGDVDGNAGDECYLDCSGAQTCPDGSICVNDTQCMYEEDANALFEEDFAGAALPANWVVFDEDGNTPNASVAFVDAAWVVRDFMGGQYAVSTSWYNPAAQADDWIVTPLISLGADDTLRWLAGSTSVDFPESYEIRVNAVGQDPADFADNPIYMEAAEVIGGPTEDTMKARFVNLADAGYANVDVYIAFRNNTNDGDRIRIDNIRITN